MNERDDLAAACLENFSGVNKTIFTLAGKKMNSAFLGQGDFIDKVREVRESAKKRAGSGNDLYLNLLTDEFSPVPREGFCEVSSLLDVALVFFPESWGKELAFLILEEVASALVLEDKSKQ
jgi:hypothetical protein